jgi:acyl carrier protein
MTEIIAGLDSDDNQESGDHVEKWLIDYTAEVLAVAPDTIDTGASFQRLGLDSSAALGMTGDLGAWLGRDLDATVAYDHPTIRALAQAVTSGTVK